MTAADRPLLSPIAADVLEGLTRTPKSLPPRLFYDARGSALFECITRLPEYYLTRTELAILEKHAAQIARASSAASVVELGAGSSAKTRVLLRALGRRRLRLQYYPVELSASAVEAAKHALEAEFQFLQVKPVVSDYCRDLHFVSRLEVPRLLLYIGSSIGNLDAEDAAALLRRVRSMLQPGDFFLLGTDLVKDEALLLAAYDDAQGVTAGFNLNVLARINRELRGHFDLGQFRHQARWNAAQSRIEMHLESRRAQTVRIDWLRLAVPFAAGETIHTENSNKYTVEGGRRLLEQAGFSIAHSWTDPRGWFAVHLARA